MATLTFSCVEVSNLVTDLRDDAVRSARELFQIDWLDRLPNQPVRDRIDITADHAKTESQCFKNSGAAAHKRISDDTLDVIAAPIRFIQWCVGKLRQHQTAEYASWPASEPFVDADNWSIRLLDLLLAEGKGRDEGRIELSLQLI
jgi:hypothetical protein